MIGTTTEYEKAQEELRDLERRLGRLQESNPVGSKGLTKAGIRKMIARLHEELAVFEGSEEARQGEAPRAPQSRPRPAAGGERQVLEGGAEDREGAR